VALALSRQALPVLDMDHIHKFPGSESRRLHTGPFSAQGRYYFGGERGRSAPGPGGARKLTAEGLQVSVVSMPSWNLFNLQPQEYKEEVLLRIFHLRH